MQVSLKLDESEWSDKFSLDTVGNVGKVECKVKSQNQTHEVDCNSLSTVFRRK